MVQGNFGNLGMYIPAILVGIVVDSKGPRLGVAIGGVLLGIGYFALYTGLSQCLSLRSDIDILSLQIRSGFLRSANFMLLLLPYRMR